MSRCNSQFNLKPQDQSTNKESNIKFEYICEGYCTDASDNNFDYLFHMDENVDIDPCKNYYTALPSFDVGDLVGIEVGDL